ncbi:MAG: hypothetical protein ACI4JX_00880 [Oscillospiraceae bacterium]
MKKLSFIISTLLLLATLTACDSNGVQNDGNPSSDTEQTEIFAEKTLDFFSDKVVVWANNCDEPCGYSDESKIGNLWFACDIYEDYTHSGTDDFYYLVGVSVNAFKSKGRVYVEKCVKDKLTELYPDKNEYSNSDYLEAVKASYQPENEYWQRYYDNKLQYYQAMVDYDNLTEESLSLQNNGGSNEEAHKKLSEASKKKILAAKLKNELRNIDVRRAESIFESFGIPIFVDDKTDETDIDFCIIANKDEFNKVNEEGSYIYEIRASHYGIDSFYDDYNPDESNIDIVGYGSLDYYLSTH